MSALDWSLDEASFKKQILKLAKSKLAKECRIMKLEYSGNKQDIINRLLNHHKKKTKKVIKKKHQKNDKKDKKVDFVAIKEALTLWEMNKRIHKLKTIAQNLLDDPHQINKYCKNKQFIELIVQLIHEKFAAAECFNIDAAECFNIAAAECFNIIYKIDMIINDRKPQKYLETECKRLIGNKKTKEIIKKGYINVHKILKENINFEKWIKSIKIGDCIDVYNKRGEWKKCKILNINTEIKNCIKIEIKSDGWDSKTGIKSITNIDRLDIINSTILPLNYRTPVHLDNKCKLSNYNSLIECYLCNIRMCQCYSNYKNDDGTFICEDCIIIYDKKQMMSHIANAVNDDFTKNIIDIIADYAIGVIAPCCNEIDECKNEIFFKNKYYFDRKLASDFDNKRIHYYVVDNKQILTKSKLNSVNCFNKQIRLFCSNCSERVQRCPVIGCGLTDILRSTDNSVCYNHNECYLCKNAQYDAIPCIICKQNCCTSDTMHFYFAEIFAHEDSRINRCGRYKNKKDKNIHCRKCWIDKEKKDLIETLIDCISFIAIDYNTASIICDYGLGVSILCCNEDCDKYIIFPSMYAYKYDCKKETFYKDRYHIDINRQKHWDCNGNLCYSYPIVPTKRPKARRPSGKKKKKKCRQVPTEPTLTIEQKKKMEQEKKNFTEKLMNNICANNYRIYNYIGRDIRIFCCKCTKVVKQCDTKTRSRDYGEGCNNKDIAEKCIVHSFTDKTYTDFVSFEWYIE